MSHFFKKKILEKITIIFLYVLSHSCSSNLEHKKNSNDLYYLNTEPLFDLYAPEDINLPIQRNDYNIPHISENKLIK